MRVIGYVRVSTDRQAEEGFGLDVQRQALAMWAKRNGHRLVDVIADEGLSGTLDLADRPGLAVVVTAIEDGTADALVVPRLDRLARQLTVQEAVLSLVWKADGRVFAADAGEIQQDDPDDPMRTFVRQVMGAAAQLERGMIAQRMRAGRRVKREQGGYAGDGSPPYGWRADAGELVPDAAEQAALARMVELRRAGASLRTIARTLTEEGHHPRPRRGRSTADVWHPTTLARILDRHDVDADEEAVA